MTKEQTIVELNEARRLWSDKRTATPENLFRLFTPLGLVLARCPEDMVYMVEAHFLELTRRLEFAELGK